jgi:thiol-disulfide isomerase/thioredoxin
MVDHLSACHARRRLLGAVLAGMAGLGMPPPARAAAEPGGVAPGLSLDASDGAPVFAGGRWRLVYLDFWASWCGPCRQSFPWMNQLHERHQAAGLRVVGINLDAKAEDAQAFLKQWPARFPIAFDAAGASAKAFGVKAMPSSYLLRADRSVLWVHRGFRPEDRDDLDRRIAAALA